VAIAQSRLHLTIERDDWRDLASCRDTDPDLFFPVGTTGPAIEQIDNAKAVDWLRKGAQPTDRVQQLLKISGAWDEYESGRRR